jgi:hypothetical protein
MKDRKRVGTLPYCSWLHSYHSTSSYFCLAGQLDHFRCAERSGTMAAATASICLSNLLFKRGFSLREEKPHGTCQGCNNEAASARVSAVQSRRWSKERVIARSPCGWRSDRCWGKRKCRSGNQSEYLSTALGWKWPERHL